MVYISLKSYKRTKNLNIFRPEFTIQKGKANVRKDIGVETIGDIVAHYPRLLAYFLRQIKYFQFKDAPDLEFNSVKGSVKEFTDYLLKVAINYLGVIRALQNQSINLFRRNVL